MYFMQRYILFLQRIVHQAYVLLKKCSFCLQLLFLQVEITAIDVRAFSEIPIIRWVSFRSANINLVANQNRGGGFLHINNNVYLKNKLDCFQFFYYFIGQNKVLFGSFI